MTLFNICLNCGKEFEAQRKSAKYCSESCKKQYQRKDSGTGVRGTKVKPVVIGTPLEEEKDSGTEEVIVPSFIPNWKKNGYDSPKDALLKAIGDVLEQVPNSTLILGNELFTNIKDANLKEIKAKYCPKHHKIQMGRKYACGCSL